MNLLTLNTFVVCLVLPIVSFAAESKKQVSVTVGGSEPNLRQAEEWWSVLTDFWTPVGWKHH